jgi:phage shock protein PspC (stress-responsive transcriptional regulator)
MNTVAMIAAFAVIAVALYVLLSFVIQRMDANYERRSGQSGRKHLG